MVGRALGRVADGRRRHAGAGGADAVPQALQPTCLAELATVAQTTVQAVVEAMEAGERDGFVRWDGDRQMVIISIPGEGDIELCDGHA